MTFHVLDPKEVADQIIAEHNGFFKTVGLSWTTDPLEDFDDEIPAVLVMPWMEEYQEQNTGNGVSGIARIYFLTWLIVSPDDYHEARTKLGDILHGWQPVNQHFHQTQWLRTDEPKGIGHLWFPDIWETRATRSNY